MTTNENLFRELGLRDFGENEPKVNNRHQIEGYIVNIIAFVTGLFYMKSVEVLEIKPLADPLFRVSVTQYLDPNMLFSVLQPPDSDDDDNKENENWGSIKTKTLMIQLFSKSPLTYDVPNNIKLFFKQRRRDIRITGYNWIMQKKETILPNDEGRYL
eukprot:gene4765-9482_t